MKYKLSALILIVTGCGVEPGSRARILGVGGAVVSRIDLGRALGDVDITPVGVTVDPNSGRRFIIDSTKGLFELSVTGTASRIWDGQAARYVWFVGTGFTDVAALGDDRFALTARSFGYLFDLAADTLVQHFCYLPADMAGEFPELDQQTDALTYDPETSRLLAQPQTFNVVTEERTASQVSTFDLSSGADLDWLDLGEVEFLAGGMVADSYDVVLLARGSEIFRYSLSAAERVKLPVDLSLYGIDAVSGMAKDTVHNTFLFIDAVDNELVELHAGAVR